MNECPCGYLGDAKHECRCSSSQVQRYRARISGPLLDHIDLHIEAPALSITELRSDRAGETSSAMRERVEEVCQAQFVRFCGTKLTANARDARLAALEVLCPLSHARRPAPAGHGTALALCPCLRPNPQSRPHHRRPRLSGKSPFGQQALET
jgi:predicted ATPase with chaperone activity